MLFSFVIKSNLQSLIGKHGLILLRVHTEQFFSHAIIQYIPEKQTDNTGK